MCTFLITGIRNNEMVYRANTEIRKSMKFLHLGPRSKRKYGHSSFMVAAQCLWNNLPLDIQETKSVTIFRKKIKTYLSKSDLPP